MIKYFSTFGTGVREIRSSLFLAGHLDMKCFTKLPHHSCRCIGISTRGFGKFSKPRGEYTYDVFADDLQSVLNSLALRDVTLVGFCMGSAIALRYIARHKGDRISNLVLCGAAAPNFTTRSGLPFGMEPGAMESLIELCYSDRAKLNAEMKYRSPLKQRVFLLPIVQRSLVSPLTSTLFAETGDIDNRPRATIISKRYLIFAIILWREDPRHDT